MSQIVSVDKNLDGAQQRVRQLLSIDLRLDAHYLAEECLRQHCWEHDLRSLYNRAVMLQIHNAENKFCEVARLIDCESVADEIERSPGGFKDPSQGLG